MAHEVLAKRFRAGDTVTVVSTGESSRITHVLHASTRQPQARLLDGLWYNIDNLIKT